MAQAVELLENTLEVTKSKETESSQSLKFSPPIYIQRYTAIKDILEEKKWRNTVSKVVDFGCSEFKFFKHIKPLKHIEHIIGIDIDESLMNQCQYEAKPMTYEYLTAFYRKLTVELFVGSISEPDSRLADVDAVVCIELIEHLYPETLEKVPSTVFGHICPKLAIFTTPNVEFNVLFDLKEEFRHYDHKFEWTRKEFENWCYSILDTYADYDVCFHGIGRGPEGTEHLGCVSQMAVFTKKNVDNDLRKSKSITGEPYKLYARLEYPYNKDERSEEEKLITEIKYRINNVFINKRLYSHFQRYDTTFEIPVEYLWDFTQKWCTEDSLINKLLENGYTVTSSENGGRVIIVNECDRSDSESDVSDDGYYEESEDCNKWTYTVGNEVWD